MNWRRRLLVLPIVLLFAQGALAAPPKLVSFNGLDIDQVLTNGGFVLAPPQPSGAAGLAEIVSVVASSISVHRKRGELLETRRLGLDANGSALGSFFEPLAPTGQPFHAKVIFDQHHRRYVVVALERQQTGVGDPVDSSRILLAVSTGEDPLADWHFIAIDSKVSVSGTDYWAESAGVAADGEAIYVTADLRAFTDGAFGGSRLWIIEKTALLTDGIASYAVYDPWELAGVPDLAVPVQPAQVYGDPGENVGTFLAAYSGLSDGVSEFLGVIRVDDPLAGAGGPLFSVQFLDVGDIDDTATAMPDSPQQFSVVPIETGDRRVLSAVWRNDTLWATAQVVPASGPDAGQATAHWWQIDTSSSAALALVQQGDIGGEDIGADVHTFMPAIAVDQWNGIVVGFSASGPDLALGAYFAARTAADPPGTVQRAEVVASGQDIYERMGGGTSSLWGDYSSTAIDPKDEATFWVFNAYALERMTLLDGEDGRWSSHWKTFSFAVLSDAAEAVLSAAENVPATISNATGEARFGFHPNLTVMKYRLTVADIVDATQAHLHCGAVGEVGPVAVTLVDRANDDLFTTTGSAIFERGTVTGGPEPQNGCGWESWGDVIIAMRASLAYVDYHTLTFPEGEIRGQVLVE